MRKKKNIFYFVMNDDGMEINVDTRVALIGIIVENMDSVGELNELLHRYSRFIIGRMGIPYAKEGINIISVAIDAPQNDISALSGKLGMIDGISAKVIYSKNALSLQRSSSKTP